MKFELPNIFKKEKKYEDGIASESQSKNVAGSFSEEGYSLMQEGMRGENIEKLEREEVLADMQEELNSDLHKSKMNGYENDDRSESTSAKNAKTNNDFKPWQN